MRNLIPILLCMLFISVSCSNNTITSTNEDDQNTVDSIPTIQSQAFLDSVFSSFGDNSDKSAAIFMTTLKGPVGTVIYDPCLLSPYKMKVNINMLGNISDISCSDSSEGYIEVNKIPNSETGAGNIGYFISTWVRLEFSERLKGQVQKIISGGDMCNMTYTLHFDSNKILNKVDLESECYEDMESDEKSISKCSYKIKVNDKDSYGNWTSITLIPQNDSEYAQEINRFIEYYDDFDSLTLIKTPSKNQVYGYYQIDDRFYIFYYDINSKKWHQLISPYFSDDDTSYYSKYADFKVIGDNLYLINPTDACGIGAMYASFIIYKYNIGDNSWTELTKCGDYELDGNKLKAIHYEIAREGTCTADHEYKEVIEIINLN